MSMQVPIVKVYSESRMRENRTSGSTRGKADATMHLLSYSTESIFSQLAYFFCFSERIICSFRQKSLSCIIMTKKDK